jgi:hypothetical protein
MVVVLDVTLRESKEHAKLTHDIHGIDWTCKTVRVIFDNVGRPEDTLNGAGFDIALVVAEAILPANLAISIRETSWSCR